MRSYNGAPKRDHILVSTNVRENVHLKGSTVILCKKNNLFCKDATSGSLFLGVLFLSALSVAPICSECFFSSLFLRPSTTQLFILFSLALRRAPLPYGCFLLGLFLKTFFDRVLLMNVFYINMFNLTLTAG